MKIKSTVAEATKYSTDALEAFYTAVDNGQARLALVILVDVIKAFEEKIDELILEKESTVLAEVKTAVTTTETQESVKQQETKQSKQKTVEKESTEN